MASRFTIGFLLFILAYCVTFSSAAVATLWQQEFEMKMEAKINELIEAKNVQLEEKVTQLEAQLELNSELRQDLTLKVTRLEAKVLEQEKILNFLLQANEVPVSPTGSKSFAANNRQNVIQSSGKSGIPRTCHEFRAANPSFFSGMAWIDPDGQGIGDDPIRVFCDMSSGSTRIYHDSQSPIDVGNCADPGCYSRLINYDASIKQIKALVELSTECRQWFKYDCYYAPFEFGNIEYAWWNDVDGNAQNFWAGNNTNGIHTCQCGIDGNCVDPAVKCNCDTLAPVQLVDDGLITDKNILPVTRLNFGRTELATSSGVHTLSHFECSGSMALNGLPTSCADLKKIGHIWSGFYSVMGSSMMESVYCDFTQLPDDPNFQKWIGYNDVKSVPTYFYVKRSKPINGTAGYGISFDWEMVNEGNAMNLTSGIFRAPATGIYFFSFTGRAHFPASSSEVFLDIALLEQFYYGLVQIDGVRVEEGNTTGQNVDQQLTFQSTLHLQRDYLIWLRIAIPTPGAYLYDTSFMGWMLEEEIVASKTGVATF